MVTADSDDTAPPRSANGGQIGQDWRPRPDPTLLTTAQLREAIGSLRELIESRLDGMDRATELLAETVNQVPSETDKAIGIQQREMLAQVSAVRELLESRLGAMDKATELLADTVGRVPSETDKAVDSLRQLLGARIDGMDTATKLLADSVAKFPSDIDRTAAATREVIRGEIRNVSDVADQKFAAVDTRFLERDTRTEQAAQESRISLDAALAAAKEAVSEQNKANAQAIAKSEIATQKQIDANAAQNGTSIKAIEDKIADIKGRLDRGEGGDAGGRAVRTEQRLNISQVVAVLAVLATVVTVVLLALKK